MVSQRWYVDRRLVESISSSVVATINANATNEDSYSVQDTLFGVFDGHGGAEASQFLGENFPTIFFSFVRVYSYYVVSPNLSESKHNQKADKADEIASKFFSGISTNGSTRRSDVEREMEDAFLDTDEKVISFLGEENMGVGSCGTVTFIENRRLYVGSVGDTRAVLFGQNSSVTRRAFNLKAKALTTPHTPNNKAEIDAVYRRSSDRSKR